MEFNDPPAMSPAVNIAHEITEDSPLFQKSPADIKAEDGAIFVSISATDDSSLQVSAIAFLDVHFDNSDDS